MNLSVLVLFGFTLAIAAPWIYRAGRKAKSNPAGLLLALYPLAVFAYALMQSSTVFGGGVVREAIHWAPSMGLTLSFALDGLSLLFTLLISGIGALVLIYAGGYLTGYAQQGRFFCYLLLFMASMLGLVLADNLIALFVFWEGTSISSYLLIGFTHNKEKSRASALQALLVTGGGGLALLAGFLLIGQVSGTWEISQLLTQGDVLRDHRLYVSIVLLVLAGAFTKSAQFPFHFWLPNAMEAPTPVSAYLHSATMVKAGIYLLARFSPALGGTDLWFTALTVFGGATMLTGGVLALLQTDLKRLLAYSTISALGTLTLLLGIGTTAAMKAFVVFLLAHALYKGALFMVAGSIDHETGTRDVEQLGGLKRAMPITALVGILAAVSLAGVGPLLSFIGKEMLFEAVLASEQARALLIAVAVVSGALFVAVAAIVAIKPFFGESKTTPKHAHEAPLAMWIGPALLAALGLVLGLMPGAVESMVSSAVAAIAGEPQKVHLALWHGFNAALALSGASILGGIVLYAGWSLLRRAHTKVEAYLGWGPQRVYSLGLDGLNWLAITQTRWLQNGYLRAYVIAIILTTLILAGTTLLWKEGWHGPTADLDARFYEVALAMLIVLAAYTALRSYSRLAALAALGVVGFCVALLYLFFGAPDLAMTQVLVDTLTVILFVLVFYHLPHFSRMSSVPARVRDAVISLAFGALMTTLVLISNNIQFHAPISRFFVEESLPKAHGRNIVNVILVDFRGLDTLGEITVLSLAGIGVYSLLKLRLQETPHQPDEAPAQSQSQAQTQAGGA